MIEIPSIHKLKFDAAVIGDSTVAQAAIVRACAAIANGASTIYNLPHNDADTDVLIKALRSIGFVIFQSPDKIVIENFAPILGNSGQNKITLNFQNAGFAMRLFIGLASKIATEFGLEIIIETDFPLSKRNIERTLQPLRTLGLQLVCSERGTPPIRIFPTDKTFMQEQTGLYHNIFLPIPNYLVKSAVVVGGACNSVTTEISEPYCSRNFIEMIFECESDFFKSYNSYITRIKPKLYNAIDYSLPADTLLSDSIFITSLLTNNSECIIQNRSNLVGEMHLLNHIAANGVKFEIEQNSKLIHSDFLRAKSSENSLLKNSLLKNSLLNSNLSEQIPSQIQTTDNKKIQTQNNKRSIILDSVSVKKLGASIPLYAAFCVGFGFELIVKNAMDMRQHSCDRIAAIVNNFAAFGVETEEFDDGFKIKPVSQLQGNCELSCFDDLPLTLAMIILSVISQKPSILHDISNDYRVSNFLNILGIE